MPHVTVKGLSEDNVREMAEDLKKLIVEASGTNEEYVKIFYSPIKRVDGPLEASVDVYWMHRPQEICDRTAEALTNYLKEKGHSFVQVTFTEFPGNLFYENNVHY
ncbi:hypothetical protein IMSAG049_00003 [Clostridiales bacterium]|nr:hypothetical protein IMSAG049_00003 [Clostridiales bacterium]